MSIHYWLYDSIFSKPYMIPVGVVIGFIIAAKTSGRKAK